jgi:hypothetical protein
MICELFMIVCIRVIRNFWNHSNKYNYVFCNQSSIITGNVIENE